MKITIIGTGYVGLPSGCGFAQLGHQVTCVDNNPQKVAMLQKGEVTLYEDGLEELLKANLANGRLTVTGDLQNAVAGADIVILAVGTPPHPVTGQADLQYVYAAVKELAPALSGYTVIATKSTVPVGTGDEVERIIKEKNATADFDVISLPEFLREGYAVYDFFNPDRIIVGTTSDRAKAVINDLYAPLEQKPQMLFVNRYSSETIKYASNAFLAMKIHYINEIANFCEKSGANVLEVAKGMGLDSRIGNRFLNPGPGFGGSCFPKDTKALSYMAHQHGITLSLVDATIKGNAERKQQMAKRIYDAVAKLTVNTTKNIKLAVLGLAFKEGTDDCRESPAVEILQHLLEIMTAEDKATIEICAYDPKAMPIAKTILKDQITYANSIEECLEGAIATTILTEWKVFAEVDFNAYKDTLKGVLDFRNLCKKKSLTSFEEKIIKTL